MTDFASRRSDGIVARPYRGAQAGLYVAECLIPVYVWLPESADIRLSDEEPRMVEVESVVLYRAAKPYWLVDAKLDDQAGLSICSGDASAEWFIRILPMDAESLSAALQDRLERVGGSGVMRGTIPDLPRDPLLLLLLETFGHVDDNPFETIKAFLKENSIPFDTGFWGAM